MIAQASYSYHAPYFGSPQSCDPPPVSTIEPYSKEQLSNHFVYLRNSPGGTWASEDSSPHKVKMEGYDANAEAEREEFQRRSDAYQPEVQGPLVKQRESIAALIAEYQNADPAFITKLAALSRNHSSFRGIKGDGKCGWTSAVFGYFETLFGLRDATKVQAEIARLEAFNQHLMAFGYDIEMLEFSMDQTWDLMQEAQTAIGAGTYNESMLLDVFNHEMKSNCVIYHFKLLASCYIQSVAHEYQGFLDIPVDEYCRNLIEPMPQEIDQPGLQGLATGVIAPAGFALDVLYLDRSHGDEVTPHHFTDSSESLPVITLLYRPGHYDLIYKDATHSFQVNNLQCDVTEYNPIFTGNPNFYEAGIGSMMSLESSIATGAAATTGPYFSPNVPNQYSPYATTFFASNASTPPTDRSVVSEEATSPVPSTTLPTVENFIRFNNYSYMMRQHTNENITPLTTQPFKNSAFNPNHFRNQSFHPHQYVPDDEKHQQKKIRRKSGSQSSGSQTPRPQPGRQNSRRKQQQQLV